MSDQLRAMREAWDGRARENARYYIASGRSDWTDEEFFASGESTVGDFVLNDMENICQGMDPRSMRVLEIGCGAGRVTRALAKVFGEVHAVDISGEMVRLARQALADYPCARVYQSNGMDLSVVPELAFDFAFSTLVFQHIPSGAVIESYLREVNRLLRPAALFKFDIWGDTTPRRPIRRKARSWLRMLTPNGRRLNREQRAWFGAVVSPEEAHHLAEATGFELRYQVGVGTQNYWLWFFKRS